MKKVICSCILLAFLASLNAQSTIDQSTYYQKYRVQGRFLTKPLPARTAKSLSAPIQINGSLWVYPMDLGYFASHPNDYIAQINAQKKYGRDDWRIPTSSELMTMEDNGNTIGLGNDIYMCTAHANGQLRLVATKGEYNNVAHIGNAYWAKSNFGAQTESAAGRPVTYQEALNNAPAGYRLPTYEEALSLIHSGAVRFGNLTSGQSLFLPFTESKTVDWSTSSYYHQWGEYWIQGGKTLYFGYYVKEYGFNQSERTNEQPQIQSPSSTQCYVRYVLDK
ncbi:MAG: hypothetical protein J6X98_03095 [Bacteroidales bacterium]|nr:hypothetical protein [Bacteroidales bacterium]